jgi:hypothetical protein
VSPDAVAQVKGVIDRAGLVNVRPKVQAYPNGPGDAVAKGAYGLDGPVLMLMADTLLDDRSVPRPVGEDQCEITVVSGDAVPLRSWCYTLGPSGEWYDGIPPLGVAVDVAVGAYSFGDAGWLHRCARDAQPLDGEVQMADVLNRYAAGKDITTETVSTSGWMDVGDVGALARANRQRFISRSFHKLRLSDDGLITKYGSDVVAEGLTMRDHAVHAPHLFPHVWDIQPQAITMDFIDYPTLAELYLYWPGNGVMWSHVVTELVGQLERNLWSIAKPADLDVRARLMYEDKLRQRYSSPAAQGYLETIEVNDVKINGHTLLNRLIKALLGSFPWLGARLHGDPNFSNVLWSLRTGTFKLLDPRPDWGMRGPYGDVAYDVGKIAYSPEFCAITHGLYDVTQYNDQFQVKLTPTGPDAEIRETLSSITDIDDHKLQLLRAYMLVSGAPLHEGAEALIMYAWGMKLAEEALR